ncbi:fimbria/pilus periplasmic chaperone [Citrobacter sp. Awk 4]|uniref:fimbrial biogenesis chaperone n=1 Tax=Citrobacter sp. Awk 4 TaxID=2963955 RepID=UPI0023046F03|nr:fimbria/pilus periplasmic chaperone [Citrobacter sp. Awk 4]MDA8481282.1 fimbria/pilus periplasmic chaperone [Citrobacter sp. Awk 4]
MSIPMILSRRKLTFLLVALSGMTALSYSTLSCAGIVLSGTRVIYSAEQNEVTVNMKNSGKAPVLAQSWIDDGNQSATPDKITSPFVLTPPINRIDAGKGQTLRISLVDGKGIPANKESVFYLNVLEIPAKSKNAAENNHLSIAFRTRVKLFYRPQGLKGSSGDAPDSLQWSISNGGVKATNPTPYYITLGTVTYTQGGSKYVEDGKMIAPGGNADFHFKNINAISDIHAITFTSINDYGAAVKHNQSK